MCAGGTMLINDQEVSIYLGFHGATFGEYPMQLAMNYQPEPNEAGDYASRLASVRDGKAHARAFLLQASKEELVDAFLEFLASSEEG